MVPHNEIGTPVTNKPLAIMAADMKTQVHVLRKNSSDYPQPSKIETATIASAKTIRNVK
jgi:hypothetical protein